MVKKNKSSKKKSIIEVVSEPSPETKDSIEIEEDVHQAIHDVIDILLHNLSEINSKYGDLLTAEDVMFCVYMVGNLVALQENKGPDQIVELFDESLLQAISSNKEETMIQEDLDEEDIPRPAPKPKLVPNDKSK